MPLADGIIVTVEGHILTRSLPEPVRTAGSLNIHLSDGRKVTASPLGWSDQLRVAVLKLSEPGPWPHTPIHKDSTAATGAVCVGIGYAPVGQGFDKHPAMHVGYVNRTSPPIWSTSTAAPTGLSNGVFDLEGRLLGLTTSSWQGQGVIHTSGDVVLSNWEAFATNQNVDNWAEAAQMKHLNGLPKSVASETSNVNPPSEQQLEAALAIAKRASVRLRLVNSDVNSGLTGVVVSKAGHIITVAHHFHLPGAKLKITFDDGKEVDGVVLGTNWVTDIGVVKITTNGEWPHVSMGSSLSMKNGDGCFTVGYPAERANANRYRNRMISTFRTEIVQPKDASVAPTLVAKGVRGGGESGGGIFDLSGRVIGVANSNDNRNTTHSRIELFQHNWDDLIRQRPAEVVSNDPLHAVKDLVSKQADETIVVEILRGNRRAALGTIVSPNGHIVTRASQLDGQLSCRMSNGKVIEAKIEQVSRELDLALLKIEAKELPVAAWHTDKQVSLGHLVAVTDGDQASCGLVTSKAREIPKDVSSWWPVMDTEQGLRVHAPKGARAAFPATGKNRRSVVAKDAIKLGPDGRPIIPPDVLKGMANIPDPRFRDLDIPLKDGDIMKHVEDMPTPNVASFEKLKKTLPLVAGDPVRVGVLRAGKKVELRFKLPPRGSADQHQSKIGVHQRIRH